MFSHVPHPHLPARHSPHGERILPFMVTMTLAGVLMIGALALVRTTLAEVSASVLLLAAIAGGLVWLVRLLGDDGSR
jgi:hypothetical protein